MAISKTNLNQLRYLLGLRCKMAYRLVRPLGWARIAVLVLLLAGLSASLIKVLARGHGPWYLVIFIALLIWLIQLFRKDRHMLRVMRVEPSVVFFAEYFLLSTPFVMLLLIYTAFVPAIAVVSLCLVLPRITLSVRMPYGLLKKPFFTTSQMPYELIAGLRNRTFTLLFLLILGTAVGWIHIIVGWIIAVGLTGLVASFYRYCESKNFIRLTANNSMAFITKKVVQGIGYYCLITGMLWIALILIHPHQWIYTGLLLFANILLLVMVITGKYAFYHEHMNIELMLSLLFGFGTLCLLIPYLVPIVVLLTGWFLKKGNDRLKEEAYDIH